jgi:glucose-1-phosphate cytidylyltransferase
VTQVVILAGGRGTRLMEETVTRPKPMVEIGGRPILWHIMKIYGKYGITDFIICLGYAGFVIKEFFVNYRMHSADMTVDLASGALTFHRSEAEPWRVTLVDTGENTQTGGRLKRVAPYLDANAPFYMTYGDGVADIDIAALMAFHRAHGRLATITAVAPPGRFGALEREGSIVTRFTEKPHGDGGVINGGFFVLAPQVLDRIAGDEVAFELDPLQGLARDGELMAYEHQGFWQAMDTLRDRYALEKLWAMGAAPWKIW